VTRARVIIERAASSRAPDIMEAILGHYTGSKGPPPGRNLAWRVFDAQSGDAIAHLGLGEPSYKLAARRRLGLMDARPLPCTVNNYIYRRLDGANPTDVRGSDILKAWHPIAAADWFDAYGEVPVHWESLVLPSAVASEVPGASFRRAGYRSLGWTTGRSARRPEGHGLGPRVRGPSVPKLVLYRGPLARLPACQLDGASGPGVGLTCSDWCLG